MYSLYNLSNSCRHKLFFHLCKVERDDEARKNDHTVDGKKDGKVYEFASSAKSRRRSEGRRLNWCQFRSIAAACILDAILSSSFCIHSFFLIFVCALSIAARLGTVLAFIPSFPVNLSFERLVPCT